MNPTLKTVLAHVWKHLMRYLLGFALLKLIIDLLVLYQAGMLLIVLYLGAPLWILLGGLGYWLVSERATAWWSQTSWRITAAWNRWRWGVVA